MQNFFLFVYRVIWRDLSVQCLVKPGRGLIFMLLESGNFYDNSKISLLFQHHYQIEKEAICQLPLSISLIFPEVVAALHRAAELCRGNNKQKKKKREYTSRIDAIKITVGDRQTQQQRKQHLRDMRKIRVQGIYARKKKSDRDNVCK